LQYQFFTAQNRKSNGVRHRWLGLLENFDAVTSPIESPYPSISMLHIIWSIIIGFIAGALASMIMHTHLNFVLTTLLGIIGSIVGGIIARLFSKPPEGSSFHPAGLILSIIGAIIVLFIAGKMAG
jgi:uncharacterized membrane protein YeaQ/YmgE (transglycosylase-associated protein family)